jgi:hypothetical protein
MQIANDGNTPQETARASERTRREFVSESESESGEVDGRGGDFLRDGLRSELHCAL